MSGLIQPARTSGMPSLPRPAAAAMPGRFGRLDWYRVVVRTFAGLVVLPTVLTALYYAFIAAPQYQATVRLAIYAIGKDAGEAAAEFDETGGRAGKKGGKAEAIGPAEPRSGGARQIAGKAMKLINSVLGNKADGKDAFIIVNYIRSRTIVSDLNHDGWLASVFASGEADVVARLAGDASREELWRTFNARVDAHVDNVSRLITVNARAFSPGEARELASRIVAASEALINSTRERTLRDATLTAAQTLQRAEERYMDALAAVRRLRDEVGVIDPAEGAMALARALTELKVIRAALETQYAGIIAGVSPDSPMARGIAARIAATNAEIAELEKQLVGEDAAAGDVAAYLADFETRETERMLAEAAYKQAMTAFDRAHSDADRQGIYLAVFEPPGTPEESRFPRGWRIVLTVFVVLGAFWSVLCLVGAGVRDQMAAR
ncbi:MAG: hypothetical protein QM698_16430 [Micropepsaceae bacterium]